MNILAINFDLNWFLTIPGMLITGGILLLLIALIIFIATAGSGKKKDVGELVKNDEVASIESNDVPVADVEQESPVVEEVPLASPVPDTTVQPVQDEVAPINEVSPIEETTEIEKPTFQVEETNETVPQFLFMEG